MLKPVIYDFKNFRAFLRAAIEFERAQDRKYSLIYFSNKIGLSSSYLKLVLSAKRELTLDSAARLGKALKLDSSERDYLITLVMNAGAESAELKTYSANKLVSLKKEGMVYKSASNLVSVFEESLLWEIFSLIGVAGFRPDPAWIASKLRRKDKSFRQIANAIAKLKEVGAIQEEAGTLKARDLVLKHGSDKGKVYASAARRLTELLKLHPHDSSAYHDAFCLILSDDEFEQIREILSEAKLKTGQVARARNKPKNKIAYFSSNLFWASV